MVLHGDEWNVSEDSKEQRHRSDNEMLNSINQTVKNVLLPEL